MKGVQDRGSIPLASTKSIDRLYVGFRSQLANIPRQFPLTEFCAFDGGDQVSIGQ